MEETIFGVVEAVKLVRRGDEALAVDLKITRPNGQKVYALLQAGWVASFQDGPSFKTRVHSASVEWPAVVSSGARGVQLPRQTRYSKATYFEAEEPCVTVWRDDQVEIRGVVEHSTSQRTGVSYTTLHNGKIIGLYRPEAKARAWGTLGEKQVAPAPRYAPGQLQKMLYGDDE